MEMYDKKYGWFLIYKNTNNVFGKNFLMFYTGMRILFVPAKDPYEENIYYDNFNKYFHEIVVPASFKTHIQRLAKAIYKL